MSTVITYVLYERSEIFEIKFQNKIHKYLNYIRQRSDVLYFQNIVEDTYLTTSKRLSSNVIYF